MIIVVAACEHEMASLPDEVRGDLADALARLDAGLMLMPLSRPMPTIGRGVYELRLRNRSGQYPVIHALVRRGAVHVLHAFRKTTQTTPQRNIEVARKRLKEIS